jgi:hypothetical protein
MKKIILLLFLISTLCISCGYETPVIDGEIPFIVTQSEMCNDFVGMTRYYSFSSVGGVDNFFGSWKPCIIAPTGKYATGDTITFKK